MEGLNIAFDRGERYLSLFRFKSPFRNNLGILVERAEFNNPRLKGQCHEFEHVQLINQNLKKSGRRFQVREGKTKWRPRW